MNHTHPFVKSERKGIGLKDPTLLSYDIVTAVFKEEICIPMKKSGPATLRITVVSPADLNVTKGMADEAAKCM